MVQTNSFNIHKSVRRTDVDLRWNYWTGGCDFDKMNTATGFIKALESGTKHISFKKIYIPLSRGKAEICG